MRVIRNPTSFEKKVVDLFQGLQADFPPSEQELMLGGVKLTMADLHRRLEEMIDVFSEVDQARLRCRDAVATRRDAMAGFRALYADSALFVRQQFGRESVHLRTYGISVPKGRKRLTTEQQVIAKAKRAAARAARRAGSAAAEVRRHE